MMAVFGNVVLLRTLCSQQYGIAWIRHWYNEHDYYDLFELVSAK